VGEIVARKAIYLLTVDISFRSRDICNQSPIQKSKLSKITPNFGSFAAHILQSRPTYFGTWC